MFVKHVDQCISNAIENSTEGTVLHNLWRINVNLIFVIKKCIK